MFGKVHRAGIREVFHALRQTHGVPESRVIHAEIVADCPDHDLAGVQPHAHREGQLPFSLELLRVPSQLVVEMQCRVTGALRVIFVRDRRAEQRHDSAARILIHGSLEPVYSLGENGEEPVDNLVPFFGIQALGEFHRAFHVGKEHGHEFAFTLQCAA